MEQPITIQSGMIYADDNTAGWNLNRGRGKREFREFVEFVQPFKVIPQVIISFEEEEMKIFEIPAHCDVEKISSEGFQYVISTWGNNKIHSIVARWVAMAQNKNN